MNEKMGIKCIKKLLFLKRFVGEKSRRKIYSEMFRVVARFLNLLALLTFWARYIFAVGAL